MSEAAIPAFLLAVLLDRFLGDPPNRFHPVVLMGSWIRAWVNRAPVSGSARQFVAGMVILLSGGLLLGLPLASLNLLFGAFPLVWVLLSAGLLKLVFALRRLLEAGQEVQAALERGDLMEGRRVLAWHLVSRDTSALDRGQVSSGVIESLAENLTDSFVAPLFYFALGGLPLAWFYRLVNTADAMIGYHTERYEYLGKFAARLDDVLNWLPARLAAFLIVVAAPLSGGSLKGAWNTMSRQHMRTASPNAGWTMSAAAGALGVVLEKTAHYRLEGGEALPKPADITRCERLVLTAAVLWVVLQTGLLWGISRVF